MKRCYLLIVFSILLCSIVKAYNNSFAQYNFSYLTEDAGLSHNYVDDIYKDSQGYMWFATHNGLTRYDGYSFVNYNSTTTPISLKGDLVYKICEDKYNRLWVASERGIDIIDLVNYCNVSLPVDQYSTIWNMMNANATHIFKDANDHLWISAANNLYCLEFDEEGNIANYYGLNREIGRASCRERVTSPV